MKRLLLIGGGHAHVHVLKSLISAPIGGAVVTLVSPDPMQLYSGMLPGWIAGHYALADCRIPLAPLCEAASVTFVQSSVVSLDVAQRTAQLSSGEVIEFDIASVDIGSAANDANISGVAQHALSIRPLLNFVAGMQAWKDALATPARPKHIVVIGGGAGGVEIALAMRHATRALAQSQSQVQSPHQLTTPDITVVAGANTLPLSVVNRVERALHAADVTLVRATARAVSKDAVLLSDGQKIASGLTVAALGARAHAWPNASGLACDALGYIETDDALRSVSHPHVFAVGDCASMLHYARPKSGVYAVRAGPPLARNLRLALDAKMPVAYTPQARSLYLISTGRQYAIASWGSFVIEGEWVWRWKDRIDRAFVARYRR
jgi:pyridine nucleotide-disulfide oxidoreductase family protein